MVRRAIFSRSDIFKRDVAHPRYVGPEGTDLQIPIPPQVGPLWSDVPSFRTATFSKGLWPTGVMSDLKVPTYKTGCLCGESIRYRDSLHRAH
jgi:hypothetical protein